MASKGGDLRPSDGHKVGSRLDLRKMVKSRAFNVVSTLVVLGAIVWGVRNAAPRIDPVPQAITEPAEAARTETAAAEAGKSEADKLEAAKAGPVAEPGKTDGAPVESPKEDAVRSEARAEPPAAVKAETEAKAAPALPSFQDTRPVITPAPNEQAAPASAPSLSFKDERPLVAAAAPEAAKPAGPLFSDARPLAAPSFRDARPVTTPSFRDTRPIGPAPEAPTPAAAAPPPPPASPPAAPSSGGTSTLVALSPSTLRLDAGGCGQPEVTTEPLDGGLMRIRISGSCRPNEAVQISYGGAELIRRLDASGGLDFNLDCFAGTGSAVELRFADGSRKTVAVTAKDLDRVSKVAVVWRAAVNLDLHVFEYGAAFEAPGHLWAKNPGSQGAVRVLAQAERRGHGFLSAVDGEQTLGDKVEVYTFFHNDEQVSGAISLALDYETRGEMPSGATCGGGALAEVDFQVVILPRKGQASRQSGVLTRVACGTRISQDARFNQSALPGLRIRR